MRSSSLQGILAMLAAVALFAVMDASMKHLVATYPPLQVSCLRGLASMPFLLVAVAWWGRWRDLMPARWPPHLLRGALAIVMLSLFIYSVKRLPLAEAYAIFLCAPLMITALSVPFLQERVGWHRWLAIAVGLAGVMTMLRPSASRMVGLGALAALGSALCYAFAVLMIRKLARTESTLSIGFSFVAVVGVVAGLLALPNWVPLQGQHWPWILILGFTGALAQLLVIEAFRKAPASVVAPLDYTALVWGLLLDWLLWHTAPDARTLIGGAIISASGVYVIYRERQSTVAAARGTPAV